MLQLAAVYVWTLVQERGTLLQHLAVACGLRSAEELAATHAAALLEEYAKANTCCAYHHLIGDAV